MTKETNFSLRLTLRLKRSLGGYSHRERCRAPDRTHSAAKKTKQPSRPQDSISQIFFPIKKKNILLPSGEYIIRVPGAPSPKGQTCARVTTRTYESLRCSLNPT